MGRLHAPRNHAIVAVRARHDNRERGSGFRFGQLEYLNPPPLLKNGAEFSRGRRWGLHSRLADELYSKMSR